MIVRVDVTELYPHFAVVGSGGVAVELSIQDLEFIREAEAMWAQAQKTLSDAWDRAHGTQ